MIRPRDLLAHAIRLVSSSSSEADGRRSVSAAYYALFHTLTQDGASVFQNGGLALSRQASRAFSHAAMRKVCEAYEKSPLREFSPPLDLLASRPVDSRIINVAQVFIALQDARQTADYDISTNFGHVDAESLVKRTAAALQVWTTIQHLPETSIFLTALLLADRWTRRG